MGLDEIKNVKKLMDIDNIHNINNNLLLLSIIKNNRFDLLKDANLTLDLNDMTSLEELVDLILNDEDIFYYMNRNGFIFSDFERNTILEIVFNKYQYTYKLDSFFSNFFTTKDELNKFIGENLEFFKNYIVAKDNNVSYRLKDCDNFVNLILKDEKIKLIGDIQNYSIDNLKLLAKLLNDDVSIPYYIGNFAVAEHLFDVKDDLNKEEMISLLNILKDRNCYDRKVRDSELTIFETLVNDNFNYLIDILNNEKCLPTCLAESAKFRDLCINSNRIDIASKCILPSNILENETLLDKYCRELDVEKKDFYERYKAICNYYEKNNNIFNTILGSSLKNEIFVLNKEHFERFINDVNVQILLSKLSEKELRVLSVILNLYNYDEYDLSQMVIHILNNINDYEFLINSLETEKLNESDLKNLIEVIQLPNNEYNIKSKNDLENYYSKKRQLFEQKIDKNELEKNKDSLLKLLFNIDEKEAKYIDNKYNHNNKNENIINNLKNSELPEEVYNLLLILNNILECKDNQELKELYINMSNHNLYDCEIPLEAYLRSQYTKLYSQTLYRIDEKNQIYGPKDNYVSSINYNGKNISICVPRVNFNFFVHSVGSCSITSEVYSMNYKDDWLDRPQLQDHFVACSYINEKGIHSIRSHGSIIFGFDSLENGSILGMGNTDIDSIGRYAYAYDGSRELQEGNGDRARFFVPSEMLKTINDGYNEIVVERRNMNKEKNKEFKRKPDYIIMMAESMESDNFMFLKNLFKERLSFISDDDCKQIESMGEPKKIKEFLKKYKDEILKLADNENIDINIFVNKLVSQIMKSKYFEDCLKATSEFDVPLVVVDKTYYFNKLLIDSNNYDEETIKRISSFYSQSDDFTKIKLFNKVSKGSDISQIMQSNENISDRKWTL